MKYSNEILIDQPREKTIELFDNPDNLKYWQKGLMSYDHLSGAPGQAGAKARFRFKSGKREFEMIETITENKLPDEMHSTYDVQGVHNIQKNYFKDEGDKTRWVSESEFQFSGFMKIMAFFWGSKAFSKQSMSFMVDFKSFAEGNPKYGN